MKNARNDKREWSETRALLERGGQKWLASSSRGAAPRRRVSFFIFQGSKRERERVTWYAIRRLASFFGAPSFKIAKNHPLPPPFHQNDRHRVRSPKPPVIVGKNLERKGSNERGKPSPGRYSWAPLRASPGGGDPRSMARAKNRNFRRRSSERDGIFIAELRRTAGEPPRGGEGKSETRRPRERRSVLNFGDSEANWSELSGVFRDEQRRRRNVGTLPDGHL